MVKEKYNAVARAKDCNKLKVNAILARMVRQRKKKEVAIILDSEKLVTTKYLIKAGVKKSNIHIPNPFAYDKLKRLHKNTYNEYIKGMFCYDEYAHISPSIVFFDYMCSLDGNDKINPVTDLYDFFYNHKPYFGQPTIVAVTLSWRGKKKGGTYNELNRLDSIITRQAWLNNMVAVKYPVGHSYNGMFFVVYEIHRRD